MAFRPNPARHVSHYIVNALAELIVKQDTDAGKANADRLKEALRKRREELEEEVRRG